jgi:hypothetical protein
MRRSDLMNGLAAVALAAALLTSSACGDDAAVPAPADAATAPDAPAVRADAGPRPGPDAGCYVNPQTHFEIINACTTAQGVDKLPVLPLLLEDGGLPPLP